MLLARETDGKDIDAIEAGVLAIIPARGGSKRIPKKKSRQCRRQELAGLDDSDCEKIRKSVSHVLLSTDDVEIAEVARGMGIDVPWLRPEALSTDHTSTLDVLLHALTWAVEKLTPVPEFGVLLEPTAPLRKAEQIDEAISLLMNSDADCVASVSELPHVFHPEEVLVVDRGSLKPYLRERTMGSRQLRNEQNSAYVLNGLVYAFRIQSVLSGYGIFGRKTIPMLTRWEDFLDIDTPEDLELANFRIGRSLSRI